MQRAGNLGAQFGNLSLAGQLRLCGKPDCFSAVTVAEKIQVNDSYLHHFSFLIAF